MNYYLNDYLLFIVIRYSFIIKSALKIVHSRGYPPEAQKLINGTKITVLQHTLTHVNVC